MITKLLILVCLLPTTLFANPVNINTADAQKIADSLKLIGEKKAQAIIAYRMEHGPFKNVDDIKKVVGIGDKIIEKNKDDIFFSETLTSAVVTPSPSKK